MENRQWQKRRVKKRYAPEQKRSTLLKGKNFRFEKIRSSYLGPNMQPLVLTLGLKRGEFLRLKSDLGLSVFMSRLEKKVLYTSFESRWVIILEEKELKVVFLFVEQESAPAKILKERWKSFATSFKKA